MGAPETLARAGVPHEPPSGSPSETRESRARPMPLSRHRPPVLRPSVLAECLRCDVPIHPLMAHNARDAANHTALDRLRHDRFTR